MRYISMRWGNNLKDEEILWINLAQNYTGREQKLQCTNFIKTD